MASDLSHRSQTLYRASILRMNSSWTAWRENDPALAMYLGGLAVECVLQAIAMLNNPQHDARHDLDRWLKKCPPSFCDSLRSAATATDWSRVFTIWQTSLRYLDTAGLLGFVRQFSWWTQYRGDNPAKIKKFVADFLEAAQRIHQKGVNQWQQSGKSHSR